MKKKLLVLMPSMFIGGAERSLLGLLDAFDYDQWEVSLFLYRHEGEFLPFIPKRVIILPEMAEYRTFDVPVKSLFNSRQWKFGLARVYAKFRQAVKRKDNTETYGTWMAMQMISNSLLPLLPDIPGTYDAAISFLGVPDVLAFKTHARVKLAWNHTDYTILGPEKNYDRKVYENIDYIVSVSDQCTNQFLKVYPELKSKAVTLENILSKSLIQEQADDEIEDMKVQDDEVCILSIGRFCEAKNFDNVPEICSRIRANGINCKWFLIGYGGDEQLIRDKIKEYGMEQNVVILGKKMNPYPYIKACDFYIQPSRYEGKAVTVREAQLLHKPVIITRFATSADQLKEGIDGVIVPMENDKCSESISDVIRNSELRENLIRNTEVFDYTNRSEINKLYNLVEH